MKKTNPNWNSNELQILYEEYKKDQKIEKIKERLKEKDEQIIKEILTVTQTYLETEGANFEGFLLIAHDYFEQKNENEIEKAKFILDFATRGHEKLILAQQMVHQLEPSLFSSFQKPLHQFDVRRFCISDLFYPDIDAPFFHYNLLSQISSSFFLLNNQNPTFSLKKLEWRLIKRQLGVPIKFSKTLINQTIEELKKYRNKVRQSVTNIKTPIQDFYDTKGQQMIYRDIKNLEIHTGTVLETQFTEEQLLYLFQPLNSGSIPKWVLGIDLMSIKKLSHLDWLKHLDPKFLLEINNLFFDQNIDQINQDSPKNIKDSEDWKPLDSDNRRDL